MEKIEFLPGSILPLPSPPMIRRLALPIFLALACIALSGPALAADLPLTFEQHVRPILKAHCFQCHGEEEEHEANLNLRLARLIVKGGDSGPAIVAGKSAESLLAQRIA